MSHSAPTDGSACASDLAGRIDTPELGMAWSEAPWDSVIFGFPVLQVGHIEVRGSRAVDAIRPFELARDACGCRLVSCRLEHEQLAESILLESIGFRFIEMNYRPMLDGLQTCGSLATDGLSVEPVGADEMGRVLAIAGTAFGNERFHVDPRLPSALGDLRYQNWVRSALNHPSQRLYGVRDGATIVAFFVTEILEDGTCYWHLNAVAPELQGRGYGKRAWLAMLGHAQAQGLRRVESSIVARNHRVLNLYARLGFNFSPPMMTFHWAQSSP